MRRGAATVLSVMAVIFYGIGLALMPEALAAAARIAELAALPGGALLLFVLSAAVPPLGAVARLLCGLWPILVFALVCGSTGLRAEYLAGFGFWPFVAAATAAGLALMPGSARHLPTLALFPFAAVLAGCLCAALVLTAPGLARLLASSPYHFVITLALAATLVALADAAAGHLSAPRERLIRALVAMLPLLGFLGTIAGLIEALGSLPDLFAAEGQREGALTEVIAGLSTAFETTLVGLVGAAGCSFLLVLLVDREAARK